ncbi:intracellular septation protein A [Streptacidiphilus sp. MAP12-16]|uniref:VC0807 family protein n=1 Tax=Streptacidiphilus sp. MAP12-16 TaxID=3156300 RepID=UPI003517993B
MNAPRRERPQRGGRGYTAVNLLVDLVVPVGLYYGLRAAGMGIYLTLVISSAVPAAAAGYRLLRERRVDGLAVYTLTIMLLGTAVSLLTGSTRFLLAKEGWLTGVSALWFLVSVRAERPLAFLFSRPLLQNHPRMPRESWDVLWERLPGFRRIWRISSVLWGVGLLADSVVRVVMAYTLSPDLVPGLGSALYGVTSLVLVAVTNIYYLVVGLYDRRSALYAPLAATAQGPDAPLVLPPGRS